MDLHPISGNRIPSKNKPPASAARLLVEVLTQVRMRTPTEMCIFLRRRWVERNIAEKCY